MIARIVQSLFLAVFIFLEAFHSEAAEKKTWVTIQGCRYVDHSSNDGDSFLIKCGTEQFFLRFYFIDTPETDFSFPERTRQQWEYFGVSNEDLIKAGARSREFVRGTLRDRSFVVHTRKAFAQGRSKALRYYGIVRVNGGNLHEMLVSEGLARNKGTRVVLPTGIKARDHAKVLQGLEDQAKRNRKGIWATSKQQGG